MPSPPRGIRLFVSGNSQLVPQLVVSLVTPTMSSQFPFPPTTAKSSLGRVIGQSSCGIHWETANLPSPTRDTPNGCLVSASAPTLPTRSLSALVGISSSRYAFLPYSAGGLPPFIHRMLCNFQVFATSEPSGHETTLSPMH